MCWLLKEERGRDVAVCAPRVLRLTRGREVRPHLTAGPSGRRHAPAVAPLGGFTLGWLSFEPGWRWSECVKPVAGTDSCQVSHVGYAVSGRITVRLDDGTEQTVIAGNSYTIPPGHDAWVESDEPFVGIEVVSAEQYAEPAG
jgi:hypothetical protein